MMGNEFISECKGSLHGGYLFCGNEDYMKLACRRAALKSVTGGSDDDFGHIVISCTDNDGYADELSDAAGSAGFFAGRRLLELRDLAKMPKEDEDFLLLLSSITKDSDIVLIVSLSEDFDIGNAKKPSSGFKKLCDILKNVNCEKQTSAKLCAWVIKKFTSQGLVCDAQTANLIISIASADMFALSSETEKLIAAMGALNVTKLTKEIVRETVSPIDEEGAFEFSNAVSNGNYTRALELLREMEYRKEKPEIALSGINSEIMNMYTVRVLADAGYNKSEISRETKLHEYRVGLYMQSSERLGVKWLAKLCEKCRDADEKVKYTALPSYTVLKNLLFEVCR